jgi:hypothetical protein
MKTILRILALVGGYRSGLCLRIENPPYPALILDAQEERGPLGLPVLSIAHYSNALCQPEMHFEVSRPLWVRMRLVPFLYRNDRIGVHQLSRTISGAYYLFRPALYDRHEYIAHLWDKRLDSHGYLAAFERRRTQR